MKIYILADNIVNRRGLVAEHGLSLFIEHNGTNIVFDTRQSDVYCRNAAAMGVNLQETDCIVLSHGHYDHCGGLVHFPCRDFPDIYVHPEAFKKRFKANPPSGGYVEIGVPWALNDHPAVRKSLVHNQKTLNPFPGIHLIAEIPSITEFEGIPQGFYAEKAGNMTSDMFIDEQMLVMETDKGLAVFLGCSHPGVVNCLKRARKLFLGQPVFALLAGMHMDGASPLRLEMTMQYMLDFDIKKVVPLHCTGIMASAEMKRFLQERCLLLAAGDMLEL